MKKICNICKADKELKEFYVNKGCKDGHENRCKVCAKESSKDRVEKMKKDPTWVEEERARSRDKYHRLNYKGKYKPTLENKTATIKKHNLQYPEKKKARFVTYDLPRTKEFPELHHWSYNQEHWMDIIPMSIHDHNVLHRGLIYDQSIMMYRDSKGQVLNSKQSHIDLLAQLIAEEVLYIPRKQRK